MLSSRRPEVAAVLAGLGLLTAGAAARAETLAEAIALAYQSNPTLQGQRATQRALDETYVQAEAGYRPSAQAQMLVTTDSNNVTRFNPQSLTPGQTQTSSAGVTLTQPIYTGGLVSSQVTAAQAAVLAGRENLRQVEETVLQNVIAAYVNVRRDQENLEISKDNVKVLQGELAETQARYEVGEITRTDVAETQAQVDGAQAQLSTSQAQLAIDRASYAAVVGQNPAALAPEPPLDKLLPQSLDQAFDLAQRNNPQLRQADFTEQASAAKVAAAKAETRPTVSLQATAGGIGGSFGLANPFANYAHNLQASAVVTVPLFTGGMTSSQIRQAAETNNADRISIEAARRQVILAVAQAWSQLLAARANLKAGEAQAKAANIAFEGSREEARVGLRSTLDVLITQQNLSNAELALVNARHDEYVAAATLLAAMGALYAQDLAGDVPVYDPKTNFDKVRHAYPWAPWAQAVEAIDRIGAPSVQPPPPPAPIGPIDEEPVPSPAIDTPIQTAAAAPPEESPGQARPQVSALTPQPLPASEPPPRESRPVLAPPTALARSQSPPASPAANAPRPRQVDGAVVQVGSFSSVGEAERGWTLAAQAARGAMAGKGRKVEVVSLGGETIYRSLVTGLASTKEARALCDELRAAGRDCLVR
jgi:outer membrane protein